MRLRSRSQVSHRRTTDGDVVDRFTRCFGYFLEDVLGLGIVWEVGDPKGAAVWVPPERSEAWAVHPWNQARISALTNDRGRRDDAFWDWVDSRSPNEPLPPSAFD